MLYETMLERSKQLEKEIHSLRKQLKHYPQGKIICAKNGQRCKWYHSDGKNRTYIPKKHRSKAEQLAVKKYLTLQLAEYEKEKYATDLYLRHSSPDTSPSGQLLTAPYYQELLLPFFTPKENYFTEWMNEPYPRSKEYPEKLIHKTAGSYCVRSKSEALIDMLLRSYHLPFRYECLLELSGTPFYPDFTIRHPHTGKIIYWEHFGMMDDSSYNKNTYLKLQFYSSHGIIPGVNLITTFETKDHPLDAEFVRLLIQYYFLT
ncbi:MAG: ATPase [Lachnospiraceae bacterium]|nr:ATPase [Lachnospiraceae bacterium]